MTRDHGRERGWFARYRPPTPVVQKIEPPETPAPATPPPPEPDNLAILEAMPTAPHDERDDIIQRTPTQVYRYAMLRGWGAEGAGLWAAYTAGIPLLDEPAKAWTLKQVKDLVFYRAAHQNGRLRG